MSALSGWRLPVRFRPRYGSHVPGGRASLSRFVRVAVDIVIVNVALALAFAARGLWEYINQFAQPDRESGYEVFLSYLEMFQGVCVVVTVVALTVFWASGFYSYLRTYRVQLKALMIAEAVTFAFVLVGMIVFVTGEEVWLPRSVLLIAWALTMVLTLFVRLWSAFWRYILQSEAEARREETVQLPAVKDETKTVLVIGGAGYIGSALLPKLLAEGFRVRVLDLFLYGSDSIADTLRDPHVEIIRADFRRVDGLVEAMEGVDHVVHLGGIVGDPACAIDEGLTIDVNLAATRLIAEVAKGHGVKHFVFASTCSVYGASEEVLTENAALNPLSLYAQSKMASEQVLLGMADHRFTPVIVRFGTIYGLSGRTRFDLVVNLLAAKAVFDGRITIFGGDQWRPFLHVDDAALAVAQLLQLPPGRGAEIFNVGSNRENYTIRQVGEIVNKVVPEATLVQDGADRDRRNYRVSFSKIQLMAGFQPQWTVEKGVRQVVGAIRAGKITDYREMRYSNEKYLHEMNGNGLAPPDLAWANELISGTRQIRTLPVERRVA